MRYLNMASPKDFSSQSLYFLESYIEMGEKKMKKIIKIKSKTRTASHWRTISLQICKKMGRRVAPSAQGEHLASLPKARNPSFPLVVFAENDGGSVLSPCHLYSIIMHICIYVYSYIYRPYSSKLMSVIRYNIQYMLYIVMYMYFTTFVEYQPISMPCSEVI